MRHEIENNWPLAMKEFWMIFLRHVAWIIMLLSDSDSRQVLIPVSHFFSFRNHPPRVFGQWVEVQRLAVAVGWIFYVPMVLPFVLSVSPYQLPPPTGSRLL